MQCAVTLAKTAGHVGEVPVGAVVVLDNQIIGEGYNRTVIDHDPSAHAEIVALRAAAANRQNHRLLNCVLYATIEPCVMCAGAIIQSRVKTVVFGALDIKAGAAGSVFNLLTNRNLNHQCEVIDGILASECSFLMQEFFKARR